MQWIACADTAPCPETEKINLGCGVVCPFTDEFRQLASVVPVDSICIDIGCSYGRATEVLGKRLTAPSQVVGLDISAEAIQSAKKQYPEIKFMKSDALRDPMSTLHTVQHLQNAHPDSADKLIVFVDIGGNRELEALVALLPWVERELKPVAIVVKSETLFAAIMKECKGRLDWVILKAMSVDAVAKRRAAGEHDTDDGAPATAGGAGRGGGKPAKVKMVRPSDEELVILRAEKEAAKLAQAKEKEANVSKEGDDQEKKEGQARLEKKNKRNPSTPSTNVEERDPAQEGGINEKRAEVAQPKIKSLNANKAPLRSDEKGTPICRFHNYDKKGCRKFAEDSVSETKCPLNHTHCHICGVLGHIALQCDKGAPLI